MQKENRIFFFISERKYVRRTSKIRISERNAKEKGFFLQLFVQADEPELLFLIENEVEGGCLFSADGARLPDAVDGERVVQLQLNLCAGVVFDGGGDNFIVQGFLSLPDDVDIGLRYL